MKRGSARTGAVTVLLLSIAVAGCALGDGRTPDASITTWNDATEFVDHLTADFDVDYDAFSTPEAAVQTADLVVVGRILAIREGFSIFSPEGLWEQRTTVVVRIEEVLAGMATSDDLILQVARSPLTSVEELAEAMPTGRALFILEDISDWRPFPRAEFQYPDGLSDSSTVYSPYPDGMWFATDAGPVGYFASFEETALRWPEATDFAALVDLLRSAADG